MTEIERLTAIEDIKRLCAQRLRAMDQKDWSAYDTLHTPRAVLKSFGDGQANLLSLSQDGGQPTAVGKDAILKAIQTLLDGPTKVTTVHHAHTPEIDVTSPTTATGIWAMEDWLWWTEGEAEHHLHGYGHYHETYEKIDGRWMIASRTLTRLRVEETPDFFRYLKSVAT